MANVAVYDMAHNQVGEISLNDAFFNVEMNAGLLHQAVVLQLASQRLGPHATKTRGLVRGGGRKPWRQRARVVPAQVRRAARCGSAAARSLDRIRVSTASRCRASSAVSP